MGGRCHGRERLVVGGIWKRESCKQQTVMTGASGGSEAAASNAWRNRASSCGAIAAVATSGGIGSGRVVAMVRTCTAKPDSFLRNRSW
jgi:hypothetical protein